QALPAVAPVLGHEPSPSLGLDPSGSRVRPEPS
ncbi:hypothetical protein A2U01_0115675, partial [Trifolium medium]|nr:hypothetical protein [Trifolium medium]